VPKLSVSAARTQEGSNDLDLDYHHRRHSWLARQHRDAHGRAAGILLNIVVGIVGAILGGLLLSPLIGGGSITSGDFNIMSLLVSFLGAVILLAIVNLFRRGRVR
jgi:uncharacterized membrane protein YeaQ/YmgE (transglycosylase-associated protein family)